MAATAPIALRVGRERFAALKDKPVITRLEPTVSTSKPPLEDVSSDRVFTIGYITTRDSLTPFPYVDTYEEFYSQDQTKPLLIDEVSINTGVRALTAQQLSDYPQSILTGDKVLVTRLQIDAHTPKRTKAWKEFVVRAISRYAFARTEWALSSRYTTLDGLGSRNASLDHIIYVDPVLLDELDLSVQQLRVLMNPALTDAYLVLPFANDLTAPDQIIKSRRAEKTFVEDPSSRFYAWSRSMVRLAHNTNERIVPFEDLEGLGNQLVSILQNTELSRELNNFETSDEAVQELQLKYRNILVALLEQTTRDQVDQAYAVRLDELIADIILATDADQQQTVLKDFDDFIKMLLANYPKDIEKRVKDFDSELEKLEKQISPLNQELIEQKDFVAEQDAKETTRNEQIAVIDAIKAEIQKLYELIEQLKQQKLEAETERDQITARFDPSIDAVDAEIAKNDKDKQNVELLIKEYDTADMFTTLAQYSTDIVRLDAEAEENKTSSISKGQSDFSDEENKLLQEKTDSLQELLEKFKETNRDIFTPEQLEEIDLEWLQTNFDALESRLESDEFNIVDRQNPTKAMEAIETQKESLIELQEAVKAQEKNLVDINKKIVRLFGQSRVAQPGRRIQIEKEIKALRKQEKQLTADLARNQELIENIQLIQKLAAIEREYLQLTSQFDLLQPWIVRKNLIESLAKQKIAETQESAEQKLASVIQSITDELETAKNKRTAELLDQKPCLEGFNYPNDLAEFDFANLENFINSDEEVKRQIMRDRYEIVKQVVSNYLQQQQENVVLYRRLYDEERPWTRAADEVLSLRIGAKSDNDIQFEKLACWFGVFDPYGYYFADIELQLEAEKALVQEQINQVLNDYLDRIRQINNEITARETEIDNKELEVKIEENTLDGLPKPKSTTTAKERIQRIPSEIVQIREQEQTLEDKKQDLESQLDQIDNVKEAIATMAEEFRALSEARLAEESKTRLREVQIELLATRSAMFTSPVFDLAQQWAVELFVSMIETKPYSQQFNPTSTNQPVVLAKQFPLLYSKKLANQWRRQRLGFSP